MFCDVFVTIFLSLPSCLFSIAGYTKELIILKNIMDTVCSEAIKVYLLKKESI